MKVVSRFEADLLRTLHALLGRAPIEGALPVIVGRRERPPCLGRAAVALVQDTLARGCVGRLARAGGWRPERHLRGERVASGRLWERTPPGELALSFSGQSLAFLLWLVADHPGDRPPRWSPDVRRLSVGDDLLLFFAYGALRETTVGPSLRDLPAFARHGLCRVAFPEDFAGGKGQGGEPDFSKWVEGPGGGAFEALQPFLASRWREVERSKRRIRDAEAMRRLGGAQEATLSGLIRALDAAGRHDLARFLLAAASAVLGEMAEPGAWVGSLAVSGLRLAERAEVHGAALAFLGSLDRLRGWEQQARNVGYFDEGYAAAQLWKADWEAFGGEALCDRARSVARALNPLGA